MNPYQRLLISLLLCTALRAQAQELARHVIPILPDAAQVTRECSSGTVCWVEVDYRAQPSGEDDDNVGQFSAAFGDYLTVGHFSFSTGFNNEASHGASAFGTGVHASGSNAIVGEKTGEERGHYLHPDAYQQQGTLTKQTGRNLQGFQSKLEASR